MNDPDEASGPKVGAPADAPADAQPDAPAADAPAPDAPRKVGVYESIWALDPVYPPFMPPARWEPIFTKSPPWVGPLPRISVPGMKRSAVRQVAGEVANWLLCQGVTAVRDDPDETRAPRIKGRIPGAQEVVEHWRKRFEPKEDGSREDPSMAIIVIVQALLSDPPSFAGGPGSPMGSGQGGAGQGQGTGGKAAKGQGQGGGGKEKGPEKGAGGEGGKEKEPEKEDKGEGDGAGDEEKEGEGEGEGEEDEGEGEDEEPADAKAFEVDQKPNHKNAETLSKLLPSQRHHGTSAEDPTVSKAKLDQLAAMFNGSLRSYLDLIGRMSSSAWSPPSRTPSAAREDVRGVELGQDVGRLLGSEYIRFMDPRLAPLAYIDWAQKRLLQIEMEGDEPRGRGPILVAIDVSPSMEDPCPGALRLPPGTTLLRLAAIITVALIRIADVQKRPVFVLGFDKDVLWERYARNPSEALDTMLYLAGGLSIGNGTKFDPPLKRLIQESRKFEGGDILFITDGQDTVGTQVAADLQQRRKQGLRLFTLLLAASHSDLNAFSDLSVPLREEADLKTLGEKIARAPAVKHKTKK